MTQKVLAARGLPASGKSYWLTEQFKSQPGPDWYYIERDQIREEIIGGRKWNGKLEGQVVKERNAQLRSALKAGLNVIIDETFLNPKMIQQVQAIIFEHTNSTGKAVSFEIKDFTDVDISLCIERDRTRGKKSVGAGAIRESAKKWLRAPKPEYITSLPQAIICDLDGTLALFDGNPYDRNWMDDRLNEQVSVILQTMRHDHRHVLITSGRIDTSRAETERWLEKNHVKYDQLFMRPESRRSERDWLFKKDIYEQKIKGKYNVMFVLDDRDQVVDMWRSLGLTCLQVDYGNF